VPLHKEEEEKLQQCRLGPPQPVAPPTTVATAGQLPPSPSSSSSSSFLFSTIHIAYEQWRVLPCSLDRASPA